jgi:hypothetical protein
MMNEMKIVPTFVDRGMSRGRRDESLLPYSRISIPEQQFSIPNSSSVVLATLSGPRSRPITSQEIW